MIEDAFAFAHGEAFSFAFATPGGWTSLTADVRIVGRRLILDNVAVDPLHTKYLKARTAVFFTFRQEISQAAKAQGYNELEINGVRRSGRNPNRPYSLRLEADMRFKKLEVPADVLGRLRDLHTEGTSVHDLIGYLAGVGTLKPLAMLALRQLHIMTLGEAKIAVHDHPAYEDRRASDEAFQDAAFAAWEEIQAGERSGSAAA